MDPNSETCKLYCSQKFLATFEGPRTCLSLVRVVHRAAYLFYVMYTIEHKKYQEFWNELFQPFIDPHSKNILISESTLLKSRNVKWKLQLPNNKAEKFLSVSYTIYDVKTLGSFSGPSVSFVW